MSKYLTSDNKHVEILGVICTECKTNEDRYTCCDCGRDTIFGENYDNEKEVD